jgi:hypothetical protein
MTATGPAATPPAPRPVDRLPQDVPPAPSAPPPESTATPVVPSSPPIGSNGGQGHGQSHGGQDQSSQGHGGQDQSGQGQGGVVHAPVNGTAGQNGANAGGYATNGMPAGANGNGDRSAGCTAPQLRRFIKSRPYVPMHELRRRFSINGEDDEVTQVVVEGAHIFVGLPDREGNLLGELLRGGEIGYELSLDPQTPVVVGVYPMRPVPRS